MKISNVWIGFQRNGVCGEPFNVITFKAKEDGVTRNFLATMTVETDKNGEYPGKFNGSCRVVSLDNFTTKWRGDVFEDELRPYLVKRYEGFEKSAII